MFSMHKHTTRRGFTLTEISIVLGVVGLMIGAIWATTSEVYKNKKITEAQRDVMVISQNLRKMYFGRGRLNCTAQTDITAAMVTAGVFPGDMIVAGRTYPQSPWGGDVRVFACSDAVAGDKTLFQIEFWATMNTKQCSPLLARSTGPSQDPGLVGLWFSGGGPWKLISSGVTYDVTDFTSCDRAAFAIRL